jgi:hypothetical protein
MFIKICKKSPNIFSNFNAIGGLSKMWCFEISKHTTKNKHVFFVFFKTWILMDFRWVLLKHKRCDIVDSGRLKF